MRGRLLMGLVFVALFQLSTSAPAHNTTHETTITFDGSAGGGTDFILFGTVASPNGRCVGGRTVKLFEVIDDGPDQLVDVDKSSGNGSWAGRGDFSGPGDARVVVTRSKFGGRNHRHICKPDEELFD